SNNNNNNSSNRNNSDYNNNNITNITNINNNITTNNNNNITTNNNTNITTNNNTNNNTNIININNNTLPSSHISLNTSNNHQITILQIHINLFIIRHSSNLKLRTEMPSLAFSDGNSTISQGMQHNQALNKAPPSPSLSPRGPDSAESTDSDYFLTSVLSMIAPARIPQVSILDYSEFIERQLITKGGNGEIRRAFWPRAQTVVILKSLIDTKHSPARLAKLFDKEVEVMNQCRYHDNIVQFYGVAIRTCDDERNGERFMVMQYYEKGDLVKLIEASPNTEEYPTFTDKMYLAMDIAIGLDHLFKCGFHHGDLHPKNILIDTRRDRKTEQGRYQAKLTDFGLRRIRDSKNLFSSQQFGGVLQFIAPERMTKNRPRYDVRCDIFALGVIYWFIIAGRYPFKDPSTFSPGAREGRIDGTPNWYYNVYTQAWDEDPNMRQQTLDEIVQVFRYNLGIQTPPIQYLDPNTAHGQYPTPSYGHEGSTFPSYTSFDSQPHHYTGSSAGGSTIRGSPMLTPASMLTPVSLNGGMSPLPSSPLFANSTASTSTGTRSTNPNHPRNRKPNVPGAMTKYRNNSKAHTAILVQESLSDQEFAVLSWPSNSPNLNIID
ncbi:hypothetical protein BGX27_003042, partial [Mortierella sp. AM989]